MRLLSCRRAVLGTVRGDVLARAAGMGAHIQLHRDRRLRLPLCISHGGGDRVPMQEHCPQPGGTFGAQGVPVQG